MACHTADLGSGQNLLFMSIKSGTIIRYLAVAVDLSIPYNQMNPCLDIYGKWSKQINNVITEIKRWENIPNRREPVAKEMIEYISQKGKALSKTTCTILISVTPAKCQPEHQKIWPVMILKATS